MKTISTIMSKHNRVLATVVILLGMCLNVAAQSVNRLFVPDVNADLNTTATLSVNVDNTDEVVAAQFNVTVPAYTNIDVSTVKLTGRAQDHVVTARLNATYQYSSSAKEYIFIIYSPTNKPFLGNSGAILTADLVVGGGLANESSYPLTLGSGAVLGDASSKNVLTKAESGNLNIGVQADLMCSDLSVSTNDFVPGENITAQWNVNNIGKLTAKSWRETLYIESEKYGTSIVIYDKSFNDELQPQATKERTNEILIPSSLGTDGECTLRLKITPNTSTGEGNDVLENNEMTMSSKVNVSKLLTLSVPLEIREPKDNEQGYDCMLTRSGDRAQDETFTLTCDDSRIIIKSQITIDKGSSGQAFLLTCKGNGVFDDKETITIIATPVSQAAGGYEAVERVIAVSDDTLPKLNIDIKDKPTGTDDDYAITEGEVLNVRISTEYAPKEDLSIEILCDHASRFAIPTVVLPAGQKSVDVIIPTNDDEIVNLTDNVIFTASALGYDNGSLLLVLNDNDVPTLQLTLTPNVICENAGTRAVEGVITRTDNIDKKVTIQITDNSHGQLHYSTQTVELARNQEKAVFTIDPVDNDEKDGERTYTIVAAVYTSSCDCAAAPKSKSGYVSADLIVTDDEGPLLSIVSLNGALRENETAKLNISRGINDATDDVTVTLSSDKDDMLEYNHSVVIPAGHRDVVIDVKVKDGALTSDVVTLNMTAQAPGYGRGMTALVLCSKELPDAEITNFTIQPTTVDAGNEVNASVTVKNAGNAPLPEAYPVDIYLKDRKIPSTTLYTSKAIAPGESETISGVFSAPETTGQALVIAKGNENNQIEEILTKNNIAESTIEVKAPFAVQLTTDKQQYSQGEIISISGTTTGAKNVKAEVEIYIINETIRDTLSVMTDADGKFKTTWKPMVGYAGDFTVGACYPGEGLTSAMAQFSIYGIKVERENEQELMRGGKYHITADISAGDTFRQVFVVKNRSSLPLSNIRVEYGELPEGCTVIYSGDTSLSANATGTITVDITGEKRTEINDWEMINLLFVADEGVSAGKEIYYYCRAKKAELKASVQEIKTTMNIDDGKDYILQIGNVGKGETGKITLALAPFMKSMSGETLPSLATGETAEIMLHFSPSDNMQLNVPVEGRIGINCQYGDGLALDFNITPVSGKMGRLCVDAMDDYTTYAEGHPHLAGATVNIYAPSTQALVATGITGADGKFTAELPEGYYLYEVSATKHASASGVALVDADATNYVHPFLSYNAVDYSWSVTETTIEDKYEIVQNITYETRVPKPVLETKMSDFPYRDHIGYVSVTNLGFIDAYKVSVVTPESSEFMTIEPLAPTYVDVLHAGETLMVPLKVTVNPNYKYDDLPSQLISNDNLGINNDAENALGAKGMRRAAEDENDEGPCRFAWVKVAFEKTECDEKTGTLIHTGEYDIVTIWKFYGNCMPKINNTTGDGEPNPDKDLIDHDGPWRPALDGFTDVTWRGGTNKILEWLLKPCLNGCDNAVISSITDCISAVLEVIPITSFAKKIGKALDLFKDAWNMLMCVTGIGKDCILPTIDAMKNLQDLDWKDYKMYIQQTSCGASVAGCIETFGDELVEDGVKKGVLGPIYSILSCIKDLRDVWLECFVNKGSGTGNKSKGMKSEAATPVVNADNYELLFDLIDAAELSKKNNQEFYGDDAFLCMSERDYEKFYDYVYIHQDADGYIIKDDTRFAARPSNITISQFDNFIDRYNNAVLYAHTGIRSANMIDLDAMISNTRKIGEINEKAKEAGFEDIHQLMDASGDAVGELYVKGVEGTNTGECATVKMQFTQDMALTRQAFRGTLTIDNSTETDMSNLTLTTMVWDEEGNVQDQNIMAVTNESVEGFGTTDAAGVYTLTKGNKGTINVLYIPTSQAAPIGPKTYRLGGTLAYTHGEQEVLIQLTPTPMTIKPTPELTLNYFMQRDVLADDPFTSDKIEPSFDAEFAIVITNNGFGDAQNVRITTAQPEFVENEKGLALDLHFVSSKLNGQETSLPFSSTLPINYGNIPALSSTYSQWWFRSNLMGHIADYDLSVNHATSYGNPDLSLIKEAKAHIMTRSINAYPFSQDGKQVIGFMANDIEDNRDLPDMMYLTDGTQERITIANGVVPDAATAPEGTTEYVLQVTPDGYGWNYGIVADPTDGKMQLERVVRNSDGREMPIRNFWQTDRTFPDSRDVVYENMLHFVDYIAGAASKQALQLRAKRAEVALGQESYTLYFVPKPSATLAVKEFAGAPAADAIATDNPATISVVFNKSVDAATFTSDDITLTIDGQNEDVSMLTILPTESADTYTISLAELNKLLKEVSRIDGYYVLTVNTADIIDAEGFPGYAGSTVSWYTKYDPSTAIRDWYSADLPLVDVYTVGGQKVRSRVPFSTALNGLQRGVYVINRKKLVVK